MQISRQQVWYGSNSLYLPINSKIVSVCSKKFSEFYLYYIENDFVSDTEERIICIFNEGEYIYDDISYKTEYITSFQDENLTVYHVIERRLK